MDGYNQYAYPIISYIFESILFWKPDDPFLSFFLLTAKKKLPKGYSFSLEIFVQRHDKMYNTITQTDTQFSSKGKHKESQGWLRHNSQPSR